MEAREAIYLLGVPRTGRRRAAVALLAAVLVVFVGGHCRGCSRSVVDENAGCLAAV